MSNETHADLEPRTTPEGDELFVDVGEGTHGAKAPFRPAYREPDRTRRHGWFCSHCGSADTNMDAMESIECARCGNRRKPRRWDAARL